MITQELKQAISQYAESMQKTVTFVLQEGVHSKREELVQFLQDIASATDKIEFVERDTSEHNQVNEKLRSPLSFLLEVEDKSTGIIFSGIPSGHEFNSLILAVLNSGGSPSKLDPNIQKSISTITEKLHFEVFVSLSCHNCPEVVQALNAFTLLNNNISSEMIDGGLYSSLVEERGIQGVPTVYLNGEVFANGKIDSAQLFSKLQEKYNMAVSKSEQLPLQDVTVVGGGPAGVSAAIYSARKGLHVTLVADRVGGQLNDTLGIENYIATSKTTGQALTGNLLEHMNDYEITLKEGLYVDSIEKGAIKTIMLSSGEIIKTKSVIIATGARWRELGVPGEKENVGNGVAYCPHCDGPFFKGKDVAVIGGGNSGIEAALDLAGIVKSVTVFEFMPELKADKVLIEQAEARGNISILKNVAVSEITAENGKVNGLVYEERDSKKTQNQALTGVFVQIGLVPNSQFLKETVELSQYGEVIIDERCNTSEQGIFACGDVTTVPYKQIVIAAGEGAKASLSAFEYLLKSGDGLVEDAETVENAA